MASFTIHALETDLDLRLTEEARRAKKSKNQLVKELLARSMGLKTGDSFADDYREFCGLWNRDEYEAFLASQRDNSLVDDEDWRS